MKISLYFILVILYPINSFSQPSARPEVETKGSIQVINQSEKYKITDNIFKLEKQFGDSSAFRLKTENIHLIDTGTYRVNINFFARWGIYSNEGALKKKLVVKPGKIIKVYLVGGDYSGIYATDPKLEIDE